MTERFSKMEFEAALPVAAGKPLAQLIGLMSGEWCYAIPVKSDVLIYVRSSVKKDGMAAETGEDSIRCWLASDDLGTPLSGKDKRWIARTSGWRENLTVLLRKLWRLGRQLPNCGCGRRLPVLALKAKNGPNSGRWFAKCPDCGKFHGWLNEDTSKKNPPNYIIEKYEERRPF